MKNMMKRIVNNYKMLQKTCILHRAKGRSIRGIDRLPNPPINKGIVIERIISIPWKVIKELYWREGRGINPGEAISTLVVIDIPIPKDPPIIPRRIYTAPIKMWWVEKRREIGMNEEHDRTIFIETWTRQIAFYLLLVM